MAFIGVMLGIFTSPRAYQKREGLKFSKSQCLHRGGELRIFQVPEPIQRGRSQNFFKSQSLYSSVYSFLFSSYSLLFSTYFLRFSPKSHQGNLQNFHDSHPPLYRLLHLKTRTLLENREYISLPTLTPIVYVIFGKISDPEMPDHLNSKEVWTKILSSLSGRYWK